MLLIDMHQPGVEARPLKQMTGDQEFGEVFFTDARVPATNSSARSAPAGSIAMLLLSFERGASAIGQYTEFRRQFDEIVADGPRERGRAADDPVLRQKLANCLVELECLRYHSMHILTQVEQGRDLGFESSMTKLQWSETLPGPLARSSTTSSARTASSPGPRPDVDLDAAASVRPVVAVGHHLGRLVPGPAQHRRRARARPPPLGGRVARCSSLSPTSSGRSHDDGPRLPAPTASTSTPSAGSTTTRTATGTRVELWKALRATRAGSPSSSPRSTTASGSACSTRRSSPARSAPVRARAVAGHRARGRGRPARRLARAAGRLAAGARRRRHLGTVALRGEAGVGRPASPSTVASGGGGGPPVRAPSLPASRMSSSRHDVGLAVPREPGSGSRSRPETLRRHHPRRRRSSSPAPAAEPLSGGRDADAVAALLRRGAVLTAADLVGIAREALTRTVAYDKERVQFGMPVGSFQALKHSMADLHVAVTMAEHAVLYAAHARSTPTRDESNSPPPSPRRRPATPPSRPPPR